MYHSTWCTTTQQGRQERQRRTHACSLANLLPLWVKRTGRGQGGVCSWAWTARAKYNSDSVPLLVTLLICCHSWVMGLSEELHVTYELLNCCKCTCVWRKVFVPSALNAEATRRRLVVPSNMRRSSRMSHQVWLLRRYLVGLQMVDFVKPEQQNTSVYWN